MSFLFGLGLEMAIPVRTLKINFATSGAGHIQFRLTDADGKAIDGYDSGKVFGDSVDRTVFFPKSLSELNGKEIRMEISMKDADLYSFVFNNTVNWNKW